MKENRLIVRIKKTPHEVFEFAINPKNTPRWVSSITEEETNHWPPTIGTIYRNRSGQGEWSEYVLTSFEMDKIFILKQKHGDYQVEYTVRPIEKNLSELEYYEWVDSSELDDPFTQNELNKIKMIMENDA